MPVIYSNNASTSLSAGINNSVTTIPIASASGFPTIGTDEYYFATIANTANTKIEVVKVTAGTTSLTVTRAQGGTSAQAFDSGDNFQLRVTADTLEAATKTDVNITGGAIAGAAITNDVIDSQHYAAASIDNEHLADNAVGTAEIANDAVTADKLANSINSAIAANTAKTSNATHTGDVTGSTALTIATDAVDIAMLSATGTASSSTFLRGDNSWVTPTDTNTTYSVGDGGLTQINFTSADNTKLDGIEASATADQTAAQIKTHLENGIDSVHYVDGSIDAIHLASDSVTEVKVAANSIDSQAYVDGSIDREHLAADIIDGTKIANDVLNSEHYIAGSIDAEHIASDAVTTVKIAGGNVTVAKMAANSVDSAQYVDGSIDIAHLSTSLGDLRRGVTHIGRDTNDYMAIGTATHEWHLDGAEDMRLTNAGVLHVENDVIAFSTTISDERLKHDIEPITDALSKVGQLNGCTFTYNNEDKRSAGLIAQDVEKVLPSAVSETELPLQHDDGIAYKTVQYDQTIGLLVEAIKELTAKVEKLENK